MRDEGRFETHVVEDAEPEMSLLELLDRLNDQIVEQGGDPVVFESDCREGVCGSCGSMVNGVPHGPVPNTPACRQHLRAFPQVTRFRLEPFRSAAFPVIRDLAVDRSAPDADAVPQPHQQAEQALDFASCIGCGACVAACPNGAAMLFVGAKLAHLALMPQGGQERARRARRMVGPSTRSSAPVRSTVSARRPARSPSR